MPTPLLDGVPETIKESKKQSLYALLGDLPPLERAVSAKVIAQTEKDGYILEVLVLDLNGFEGVPAYFVKPKMGQGQHLVYSTIMPTAAITNWARTNCLLAGLLCKSLRMLRL